MTDKDFALTILSQKIRQDVFESPPRRLKNFKTPESRVQIGSFLTEIALSLEGGSHQQMTDSVDKSSRLFSLQSLLKVLL
jgi:hypothetical protein